MLSVFLHEIQLVSWFRMTAYHSTKKIGYQQWTINFLFGERIFHQKRIMLILWSSQNQTHIVLHGAVVVLLILKQNGWLLSSFEWKWLIDRNFTNCFQPWYFSVFQMYLIRAIFIRTWHLWKITPEEYILKDVLMCFLKLFIDGDNFDKILSNFVIIT